MNRVMGGRWYLPRDWSLALKLTMVITALVLLNLAWAIVFTLQTAAGSLAEQIGGRFQSQAVTLSRLVGASLVSRVQQLQVLALARADIIDVVAAANAAYTGTGPEIEERLLALDQEWRAAPGDAPLIVRTIKPDPAVNPAAVRLAVFLRQFAAHTEVMVTDRYGALVAASERLSDYYQADEEWWQRAWNRGSGAIYISDPEYDESARVMAFLVAIPLKDPLSGGLIGVLRSTLEVEDVYRLFDAVREGRTEHALLLDRDGRVLHDASGSLRRGQPFTSDARARQRVTGALAGYHVAPTGRQGPELYAYAPVRVYPGTADVGAAERAANSAVRALRWTVVVRQCRADALASMTGIVRAGAAASAVAVVLAAGIGILLARAVTRPLVRIGRAAREIADGDLSVQLPRARGFDEVGRLTGVFGEMSERLREQTGELARGVRTLASSAAGIRQASAQMAAGSAQIASAVSETTLTLTELRQSAESTRDSARGVSALATETARLAGDGQTAIVSQEDELNRIREQTGQIMSDARNLDRQCGAIESLNAAVNELADQLDVLSVNAQIEAARAGGAGVGFAVVAREITTLADQAKQATAQVRRILQDIRGAARTVVNAAAEGRDAVEKGRRRSRDVMRVVQSLAAHLGKAVEGGQAVRQAGEQQLAAVDQVLGAMRQVKDASALHAGTARQLDGETQKLNRLGDQLRSLAEHYKV